MAESFSLQTSGPVLTQGAPNVPPPAGQANLPGISFSGGAATTPRQDPTVDVLLRLGADILAPKVKEEQQRQYMEGVQRAAAGEALNEIIDKQPWYTQIFGPATAVQGARAYTVQAQLAKFSANLEQQMPELAKQGPEAIQEAVFNSTQSLLTGDNEADALIQRGAAEQFAPLFKRHAREHYIYNQKKALNAQALAMDGAARSLQSVMEDPQAGEPERRAAQQNYLTSLAPFAGQPEESHSKNITAAMRNAATQGNFQAIRTFKDTKGLDGKSLFEKLPVDEQRELQAALPGLARKYLDEKIMPNAAVEILEATLDTRQNPKDLAPRIAAINAKYAKLTGISDMPLVTGHQVFSATAGIINAQQAEDARQRRAAEAALAKFDSRPALAAAAVRTPGALLALEEAGEIRNQDAAVATSREWRANHEPAARAQLIAASKQGLPDTVHSEISQIMAGTEYSEATGNLLKVFAMLPVVADSQYDPRKTMFKSAASLVEMEMFAREVKQGTKPELAWTKVKVMQPAVVKGLHKDDTAAIQKAIGIATENKNENIFGWDKLDAPSMNLITAMAAKHYGKLAGTYDPASAAKLAVNYAMAEGDQIGKIAWANTPGANPAPLLTLMHDEGKEATGNAFMSLMKETAKGMGADLSNYMVIRNADDPRTGEGVFTVITHDAEMRDRTFILTTSQLRAEVKKLGLKPRQTTRRRDRPQPWGPGNGTWTADAAQE